MNRIVFSCSAVALTLGLAACDTNFKATDKLMRNEHRIVQNTRVFQQPEVVQRERQQAVPVIQQVEQQSVTPVLDKKIVTRTVTPEPVYKTVYIDAPTVTKTVTKRVADQRISVRNMTKTQIFTLQRALAAKGFYKAPVDGVFGIRTAQALATYQSSAGVSGPVTSQILGDLGLVL